jgi:hypothetical protein
MIKACDAIIVAQVEIMILVKPSRDTWISTAIYVSPLMH